LLKTLQFKTVCKDDSGYITQLKQQKIKKMILLSSTSPHSQCAEKQYHLFWFFNCKVFNNNICCFINL